jgi:hypothetical protein
MVSKREKIDTVIKTIIGVSAFAYMGYSYSGVYWFFAVLMLGLCIKLVVWE